MNKADTFQKIANDRNFIIDCYNEMLSRINEVEVIELLRNNRLPDTGNEKLPSDKIIQSLSIYFQLMTLVEENATTQYRRKMENHEEIHSIRGSWAEAFKGRNNLGVVSGISYLHYDHRDIREISEYLENGFIKGLKFYPGYEPFYPNNIRLKLLYEMAIEYDVPVMFHSGDTYAPTGKIKYSHPLHIDDLAVDYPDLKIVICHVGNPWIKDCMEVVYKNKNVYADISGLVLGNFSEKFERFMKKEIEEMITYAGDPNYLLYGTDWPISNMESYLKFVGQLDLEEEKKELILWKNAAKLFNIDVTSL